MRNLLFTFTLLIIVFANFTGAAAQSINNTDRQQIERELERQIARDTNDNNVRVRLNSADTYNISSREMGVRGQASLESRRNNRSDIWYDVIIDTRRNNITRATWSYGRTPNNDYDRDRNDSARNALFGGWCRT